METVICGGGGSVLLFNGHNWDLSVPAPLQTGTVTSPLASPGPQGTTVCCSLQRDKAEGAALVGGGRGWGAGELEEPG